MTPCETRGAAPAPTRNRPDSRTFKHKPSTTASGPTAIDFTKINCAALAVFPTVLARLLPEGKLVGREYLALNPRRTDRHRGSFKINVVTGRWADFATGDKGGDPVSLVAFIEGISQGEAAKRLARMLGVECGLRHNG